jgi:hypothetical protein
MVSAVASFIFWGSSGPISPLFDAISIRAKSLNPRLKAEIVAGLIVEPEAVT